MKKQRKTNHRNARVRKQRVVHHKSSSNIIKKKKRSPFMTVLIVIMSIILIIAIIAQLKHIYLHISGKGHGSSKPLNEKLLKKP
ncbi:hypothetical protein CMT34_17395 [Elizabethkingia anophelis]|jgi:hypothetical protein|nr:hypothetical protein [Elizabethkingia anophelis]